MHALAGQSCAVKLVFLGLLAAGRLAAEQPTASPAPPGMEGLPEIVARVDQQVLTRAELVRELVGSGAAMALDRLARRMLIEQAAAKAGVTVSDQELNDQLVYEEATLVSQKFLPPSEAVDTSFAALVRARFQMTVAEYKDQFVRQKLLTRKLLGRELRPTEPQLRAFFQEKTDLFQPQTRYRAAHILITPLTPSDLLLGGRLMSSVAYRERLAAERKRRAETDKAIKAGQVDLSNLPEADASPEWAAFQARAKECLAQLRAGHLTWEKAVATCTQDPSDLPSVVDGMLRPPLRQRLKPTALPGEVGEFTKDGPLVPEFYDAVRTMRPGEYSEPVRTGLGYHIIRLLEVKEVPRTTFEQARAQVERTYVDWVIRAQAEEWLEKLVQEANLHWTHELLWPPRPGTPAGEPDPAIGRVNGQPLCRSTIWRELVRTDGAEALQRLINREISLGPLKRLGPARLEWNGTPSQLRKPRPPAEEPIAVSAEDVDRELTPDRLRWDQEREALRRQNPQAPKLTWEQYLFERYGQTPEEFSHAIEASAVLAQAVRLRSPCDDGTLRFQYQLTQEYWREPVKFEVSHILIVPAGEDLESRLNASKLAQEFQEQLAKGNVAWDDLCAQHSADEATRTRSGRLGILDPDTPDYPEIYPSLTQWKEENGKYPPPIKSKRGYHVVRVDRRVPERIPDFEEVRELVQREYLRGRAEMYLSLWVRAMQNQARVKRFIYEREPSGPPDVFPLPEK